ncbi:PREDICTED: LOW QUALITY PROTEIN: ras-related protein Rab-24-like, partial [Ceratosolen solmsi marchali]|uniref:LOW QUALITY PROTEIN: ras-related protein Rab-24-like n=1 Tax=Ceratosolen solmsi marchali TaxID=326594 RepID=A0AAJ7E2P5_9HYME
MTNPQDQQRNVKVVLLGHQNVGKTSLMNLYVTRHSSQIIVVKVVLIRDHIINFHIWDTAGLERYDSMTTTYYRNAAAAIVCFDLTEPETLEKAKEWVNRVRNSEENCMIYLCGTKRDILQNDNRILMIAGTYAEEANTK